MDKTIICFHNPEEDNGYLSNWWLSDFKVDGIKFTSAEQYMMYGKAKLFGDVEAQAKILAVSDVATIKALGREVKGFDDGVWTANREKIVYTGLKAKFRDNEELKNKLLDTGDAVLAECAVHDRVWGIGLSMKDPNRFDMNKWRGLSLLGKLLMRVREEFRDERI